MKNTLIISAAAMLFYATSQICGCGCKVNGQTLASNEIAKSDPKTVTFKVTGMTCGGCANNIHSALSKKEGVLENEVKYPGDVATVKYDPEKITENEIIATVEKAGYKAEVMNEENMGKGSEKKHEPNCKKSCCSKKKGGC